MNTRERGILIGLAVVLAAGTAFIVKKAMDDKAEQDAGSAGAFDTERLPDIGTPLREETTPGGVVVKVFEEGRGEPVQKGQAMDIAYTGYSAVSGAIFQRDVRRRLILEQGGVIPGWVEGLAGIKPFEKRRLLIPSEMGFGANQAGNLPPNSDLVFDVQWVKLDMKVIREGSGKEAKRGSKIIVHYKGTLESGFVFDSSFARDEPVRLTLKTGPGGVIDGWVHGISGMRVGGSRELWIPWHMAYGKSAQKKIPGYSNLKFLVELIAVE